MFWVLQVFWKVTAYEKESFKCQFDPQSQTFQWRHAVLPKGRRILIPHCTVTSFTLACFSKTSNYYCRNIT